MFTNNKAKYYGDNKVLIEAACLKTDTKPTTGIANGSKCIEMDTGKTYMFNEEDSEWEELPSPGSGGGGGGGYLGVHTATVNVTFDTSSISGDVAAIEYAYLSLGYDDDTGSEPIKFAYDNYSIPVTELGTPTQMQIPTSDDYPAFIGESTFSWLNTSSGSLMATEITAVSGSVTQAEYGVIVTGDCTLNIKVGYQG